MKPIDCETVRQAAMAIDDGEPGPLMPEQIEAHLAQCLECGHAIAELRSLNRLLDGWSRQVPAVESWPQIEARLKTEPVKTPAPRTVIMFTALISMLLIVRALVLAAPWPREWIVRAVALSFVLGWFFVLRDNPLIIHPRLSAADDT
jgi:predicted anti-sigma-YlaC factor YlaD